MDVQIPANAVADDAADVAKPVRALLEDLSLLGTKEDLAKAEGGWSILLGPPQSVSVIEAGLTAGAKYWSAGLAAGVAATWASVFKWWGEQDSGIQATMIGGAFVVMATAVLAIGYLLAADVRGRAAASVATLGARATVAETMIEAARDVYEKPVEAPATQLISLPSTVPVRNVEADDDGWQAVAIERQSDGTLKYVIVKGSQQAILPASKVAFVSPPGPGE
jgi:hypothetical protein